MKRIGLVLLLTVLLTTVHAQDVEPQRDQPAPGKAPPPKPVKPRDFVGPRLGIKMSDAPKQFPQKLVHLETKFAQAPAKLAKDGARLLNAEELNAALPGLAVITAPALTCYAGQRANISVANQKTYVRTYDDKGMPVTAVVSSGTVVDVRATPSADEKKVRIEFKVDRSALRRPIAKLQTPQGPVGMPEVVHFETAFTLDIDAGKRIGVVMPAAGKGIPTLVVLKASVIKPFFEEKK